MSFNEVQNNPRFKVQQSNRVLNPLVDYVGGGENNPLIVYAMFSFDGEEFRIKHMNLQNAGEFTVTAPGPTQTVVFTCSPPYKRVLGVVSFGGDFQVDPQPQYNIFSFTMTNLSGPFVGTVSYMIEK
jgi:hypothetical protein